MSFFLGAFVAVLVLLVVSCDAYAYHGAISEAVAASLSVTAKTPANRIRRDAMDLSTIKIGRCEMSSYSVSVAACGRVLYMPYRDSGNTKTCRSQWPVFMRCIFATIDGCLQGVMSSSQISQAKSRTASAFESFAVKEKFCDDGGISRVGPPGLSESAALGMQSPCKKSLAQTLTKCHVTFHRVYDIYRGDPSLCKLYDTTLACTTSALKQFCNDPRIDGLVKMADMVSGKKANPFCSKSQGGKDVAAIMTDPSVLRATHEGRDGITHDQSAGDDILQDDDGVPS